MAKHYVVCENMCLQEAYSKDEVYSKDETYSKKEIYSKNEIDKNLSNIYTKNQIDKKINDTIIVQHTFSKVSNWGDSVTLPQTEPMDEYYVASVMCAYSGENGMVWSNRLSIGNDIYLDQLNVILRSSPNQVNINFMLSDYIGEEYLSFSVRVVLKRYRPVDA